MKIKYRSFVSIVIVSLFYSSIGFAAPKNALNKDQVTKLISGNTIDGSHMFKDYQFSMYFKTNGKHVERRGDALKPGSWHVSPKGKLCWSYDAKEKTFCRWIVDAGKGTYYKVAGKKKKVRKFKVLSGNAKSL